MKALQLTGKQFGKVKVVGFSHFDQRHASHWHCECECGNKYTTRGSRLTAKTKACAKCRNVTHGNNRGSKRTPAYKSWGDMIQRTTNPDNGGYPNYGGRGIAVCEEWRRFEAFLADMGDRPAGKTLERIDVDGDYCPENCKWATYDEQNNNQRKTRLITHDGETLSQAQWAKRFGVHPKSLSRRLDLGLPLPQAMEGLASVA